MPTEVKRSVRVAARLAKEVALLLAHRVRDPRVANVTVTRVTLTDDLRTARVHVRLLDDGGDAGRRKEALVGLSRAAGMLRSEAGRRLGLRHAPELTFAYDDGLDHTTRVEELLHEIQEESAGRKGPA
jgi:ribosome-binding factor A